MKIFDRVQYAYLLLNGSYRAHGLTPWLVRVADTTQRIGITLDWPLLSEEDLQGQVETVDRVTQRIAAFYILDVHVEGPTWATGGALVMYVGLEKKDPIRSTHYPIHSP